jgi:GH15 family glucan-1,4-alpha-glucosidase
MKKIHKYDMGVVGNCSFLAYIDKTANVKWMCMPRFDSSFIFGSLLDENKGGEFNIRPANEFFTTYQFYIENTNILCTEFTSPDGKFRVIDYAPRFYQYDRFYKPLMLCRHIELIEGSPFIKVKCNPVGDYGNIKPEIHQGSNHLRYLNIGSQVRLATDIPLTIILNEQSFVLSENRYIVFTYGVPLEASLIETCETFLKKTKYYWINWIKSTSIPNIYQQEIIRSALILKLHQYEDTGAIIASGSTSLPESDQSTRNWDYRYCWMRDSYYALTAFNNLGHFEELEKYFHFIENIILNEDQLIQPLYSVAGDKVITEKIIDLAGYQNNLPVRIGNDAYRQVQNDVYGQLFVSLLPLYTDFRLNGNLNYKSEKIIQLLIDKISKTINEPDFGLWEFRNRKQLHCYTSLFHWAGSKTAEKIAVIFKNDKLKEKAQQLSQIAAENIEKCYDLEKQVYTQAIGSTDLDASCLQLITMNYLNPNSERARLHLEALEKGLMNEQGLFYRYVHKDDFGIPDTNFLICSFWYVEALACVGRIDDAIKNFEKLLNCTNHLGLLSEDVDKEYGQWGNFPQTYSHIGLMNAVFRIAKKLDTPIFF